MPPLEASSPNHSAYDRVFIRRIRFDRLRRTLGSELYIEISLSSSVVADDPESTSDVIESLSRDEGRRDDDLLVSVFRMSLTLSSSPVESESLKFKPAGDCRVRFRPSLCPLRTNSRRAFGPFSSDTIYERES